MLPLIHDFDADTSNPWGVHHSEARLIWDLIASNHHREHGEYPEAKTAAGLRAVRENYRVWFRTMCTPRLLVALAQKEAATAERGESCRYTANDIVSAWALRAKAEGNGVALSELPEVAMERVPQEDVRRSLWDRVESYNRLRQRACDGRRIYGALPGAQEIEAELAERTAERG